MALVGDWSQPYLNITFKKKGKLHMVASNFDDKLVVAVLEDFST